ncbi:unnamed protein product [Mytilus edulis]|uniref:Uncharacterized protein n=1 Tax=Mytilus edulis TaxID=6550 RepID=A0A8S3QDD3_MYTED|nr:unnamed protein product [Mytilus edulis]
MPCENNSDKKGNKKNVQTVQTLLAAKKGSDKGNPAKRTHTDVSMDSSTDMTIELSNLHHDLDSIKESLEGVVKRTDFDKALKNIVRKDDLETIVTSIVTKLVDSRKFNIKVMNFPENKDENFIEIFKNKIVKDTLKITIRPDEIQAIHRIPGKQGEHRPFIVKLINSEVKYRIMREKKKHA